MNSSWTSEAVVATRVAAVAVFVLLAAGCSHLDLSRDVIHNPLTDVLDSGKPYVERDETPEELRRQRFEQALTKWEGMAATAERDYNLGVGDIAKITVFDLEKPGLDSVFEREMPKEGLIELPLIGKLRALGESVGQFERSIVEAYNGTYLKNPRVSVSVTEYRSQPVVVTGAVGKPGVYYLKKNKSTVLEVLADADGLVKDAGDQLLVIRGGDGDSAGGEAAPVALTLRDGIQRPADGVSTAAVESAQDDDEVTPIDIRKLIDEGDMRYNVEVRGGDILTVNSASRRFVYILGYVRQPGAHEIKGGENLDALRAVARAGGLTSMGRADKSYLLREESGRQTVIPVDIIKMARGVRPLVYIEPGDTLIVGTSLMGRLTEIVSTTVGVGASYTYQPAASP